MAFVERLDFNGGYRVRNGHALHSQILERTGRYGGNSIRNLKVENFKSWILRPISNLSNHNYAIRKAVVEWRFLECAQTNVREVFSSCDCCKARAVLKRIVANACHGRRKVDACETSMPECSISYRCEGTWRNETNLVEFIA